MQGDALTREVFVDQHLIKTALAEALAVHAFNQLLCPRRNRLRRASRLVVRTTVGLSATIPRGIPSQSVDGRDKFRFLPFRNVVGQIGEARNLSSAGCCE